MRVALLTPEYPPAVSGGIATATRNLATAMVDLGHEVHVVRPGHADSYSDGGVDVRVVDARHPRKLGWLVLRRRLAKELRGLVRCHGVEIIEAPDWGGLSARLGPGCPVVVRCHGSATYFADLTGSRLRRSVRLTEAMALRRADGVAGVSDFASSRTQALFDLRRDVATIPNSVDVDTFRPSGRSPDPDLVLYAGTVMRRKGAFDLCRTFSEVVRKRPSARLVVVGRDLPDAPSGSPSTWQLCAGGLTSAARRRTEYLGARPHEDMPELLAAAALCLFPSHAEALPVAWLEAAACGRAIVGYDSAWAREIVRPESGILVRPGDQDALAEAVVRLMEDEVLRRDSGDAARSVATQRFARSVVAKATIEWYEAVRSQRAAKTAHA